MAVSQRNTKLNKLLSEWKDGMVYTSPWLTDKGYSPDMLFAQDKVHNAQKNLAFLYLSQKRIKKIGFFLHIVM